MSRRRRKPRPTLAHYAAPIAFLVGVTIVVLLLHSALKTHGTPTTTVTTSVRTTTQTTTTRRSHGKAKRFYTVQTGDTFGSIAAKEGISVEQLQSLNPGVSSNALQVGQKLRIG
jgi:peptidoglycan lytic transglycosylase D